MDFEENIYQIIHICGTLTVYQLYSYCLNFNIYYICFKIEGVCPVCGFDHVSMNTLCCLEEKLHL